MNPDRRDGERLAVLESQTSEIKVSMGTLSVDIRALNSTVDRYFTQSIEKYTKVALEMESLKQTVAKLEKKVERGSAWKWLSPTLSAGAGAVLAVLIINYLQHPH